jgi:hypothetical protein
MSQPPEFTEEELRAMEAEMERITVDDVLLQTIVSLINLAARKAGLTAPPGQAPAPDWEQVRQGIEGARALMPLVEPRHAEQLAPIRDGLSQLQLHYARESGATPIAEGAAPASAPGAAPQSPAEPKRPEPPSRLWVPGQ